MTDDDGPSILPLRGRALAAVLLVAADVVLDAVSSVGSYVIALSADDQSALPPAAAFAWTIIEPARYARTPLAIVAGVVFVFWFARAYANIRALGAIPRKSTADAVWCFFIPVISLYVPYQCAREVWAASLPAGRGRAVLVAWWATWLTCSVVGIVALAVSTWTTVLASTAMVAISGAFCVTVIRTITQYQELRRQGVHPPQSF